MNSYSYMATTRKLNPATNTPYSNYDHIVAQRLNNVSFFTAPGAYNMAPGTYTLDTSNGNQGSNLPPDFKQRLIADLKAADAPVLTLFVHGLGNTWTEALVETAAYGAALVNGFTTTARQTPSPPADGRFTGVVIGFTWPSFGIDESATHYAAYHWHDEFGRSHVPQLTPNIRGNIIDSEPGFLALLQDLTALKKDMPSMTLQVICHSEGNYMMMAACSVVGKPWKIGILIDNTILLAADFSRIGLQMFDKSSAFYQEQGLYAGPGSGWVTASLSKKVWTFFSGNDTTLKASKTLYRACHNPDGLVRLGYSGPTYDGTLLKNVRGVNCSAVVHGGTAADHGGTPLHKDYEAGWIPKHYAGGRGHIDAHSSYRYVPQILWATSQILNGSSAGLYNIAFAGQAGTMTFDKPPGSQPASKCRIFRKLRRRR